MIAAENLQHLAVLLLGEAAAAVSLGPSCPHANR